MPTPYPDVNALLEQVFLQAQAVLGPAFKGMYLDGSLACGDFDEYSDIDFVIAVEQGINEQQFEALRALHDRLSLAESPWAVELEGWYISLEALRRHDPRSARLPNLERGKGERLKWVEMDQSWDVHRWMLREQGIRLSGPPLPELVEPVSPEQLRRAVQASFPPWLEELLAHPDKFSSRGYQSYLVLTMCRALHTLEQGKILSKQAAAAWAKHRLGPPWQPLIEGAWQGRQQSPEPPSEEDLNQTRDLLQLVLKRIQSG